MAERIYRIGIVGASSLAGKELADTLSEFPFCASNVVLLEDEVLIGTVTAAGNEAAFIQKLEVSSFERMDFAFFAGSSEIAEAQWRIAREAGASIVDLTYSLSTHKDVQVRAPWIDETLGDGASMLDIGADVIVAAHPAAVMLALLAARLTRVGVQNVAATVLQPASEYGLLAMDELQKQTVNLLSFQPLPKEQYDAQVTFNLLPGFGNEAKIRFEATKQRIVEQYTTLSAGRLPEIAIHLVHAPVFHGYTASVLVDLAEPKNVEQVEAAVQGPHIEVVADASESPSNLSASGQGDILVRVTAADTLGKRFWVWLAADNLKLHAQNAVACAMELRKLRPAGKVQ